VEKRRGRERASEGLFLAAWRVRFGLSRERVSRA